MAMSTGLTCHRQLPNPFSFALRCSFLLFINVLFYCKHIKYSGLSRDIPACFFKNSNASTSGLDSRPQGIPFPILPVPFLLRQRLQPPFFLHHSPSAKDFSIHSSRTFPHPSRIPAPILPASFLLHLGFQCPFSLLRFSSDAAFSVLFSLHNKMVL